MKLEERDVDERSEGFGGFVRAVGYGILKVGAIGSAAGGGAVGAVIEHNAISDEVIPTLAGAGVGALVLWLGWRLLMRRQYKEIGN